jgi:hypothetical protein
VGKEGKEGKGRKRERLNGVCGCALCGVRVGG